MSRWIAVALLSVVVSSCGGDSPTAPSPILSFTPDTTTPASNTFWLEDAREGVSGQIAIRVHATFFTPFSKFRGTLLFDDAVLSSVNFTDGTYMQQGGSVADVSVTGLESNHVTIRIDRPDSQPGAVGNGVVLVLRFKATGPKGVSSPLQWDDAHAYTANFSERLSRTYGGVVHVQ